MANETSVADHSRTNPPTVEELVRMPDYRQDFYLRYCFTDENRPSQSELDAASAVAVRASFEEIKGKAVNRFIYFIQSEVGPIKIGVASDVKKRLGNLRGSSPVKLELLFSTRGGSDAEYRLHHMFRAHRLHGEWFTPHPDLLDHIARLRDNAPCPTTQP